MKKNYYEAPEMEVIEVALESGFAASGQGGAGDITPDPGW